MLVSTTVIVTIKIFPGKHILDVTNVVFAMLDERDEFLRKTPFLNKDYKSLDLDIQSYIAPWFYII